MNNTTRARTARAYQPKYWNHKGKYQAQGHEIFEKFVPHEGTCENQFAELWRCVNRVYYDVFNNGGGNLIDSLRDEVTFVSKNKPETKSNGWTLLELAIAREQLNQEIDYIDDTYNMANDSNLARALDKFVDEIILYIYPKLFPKTSKVKA